ncbi:MAG: acyltransferase family protein [Fibrobacteres bacterium]|nr:acyltransferase family protein [Fibrobacterota bacterium]
MKLDRRNNFEVLRIILMVMIVMHHLVVHSLMLRGLMDNRFPASDWGHFSSRVLIDSFLVVAVNVFILISGYFGVKFKTKNIVILVASGAVFSLISMGVMFFVDRSIVTQFSPWAYWFLVAYFVLLFVAQYVDKLFNAMNDRQVLGFAVVVFFLLCIYGFYYNFPWLGICGGASVVHLLGIYCFGRTIHRFEHKLTQISRKIYLLSYIGCSLAVFTLVIGSSYLNHYRRAWSFFTYNNPIVVVASFSLFMLFLKTKINLNVRWLSGSVFGVYLFHDNIFIRNEVLSKFSSFSAVTWTFGEFIAVPVSAIVVFLVCFPISYIVNGALNRVASMSVISVKLNVIDDFIRINEPSSEGKEGI